MASRFRRCAHCGLTHERVLSVCPFTGRAIDASGPSASEPPVEGEDPILGRVLDGRYQVEALIGHGGMGAVYRAKNLRIDKPVAIKVLSGDGVPAAVSRFMREARAAARVVHDNVVSIYDVGALPDETPFLVMELLEGESLEDRLLRVGALDLAETVDVATQILAGLEAVHASGAIHRDVKPANVFLARTPDGEVAKLLDFGLSKSREESRLTRPGEVVGTPSYLAPEQARGLPDLDARVDVWASGVVFYEMLTGRTPFEGASLLEIVTQLLSIEPPAPSTVKKEVPRQLDGVVAMALHKDRTQRYASAEAMRLGIMRALRGLQLDTLVDGRGPQAEDDEDSTMPVQRRRIAELLGRPPVHVEDDLFEVGDTELLRSDDD